jgi:protein SCO1/2
VRLFAALLAGSLAWGSGDAAELSPEGTNVPARFTSAEKFRPGKTHPLLHYKFTNELGQAVSLSQFHGQALALTFIFTRCPIPEYCPRLSKNFQQAAQKLSSLPQAPTNWHFLSITFDPEFDTPPVLKAYAQTYKYNPRHWSFLTGPADKVAEFARLSDVNFSPEGSLFNHNFRTLIINAAGDLQMAFPTGGDLADAIVDEILKAASVTNRAASREKHPDGPGISR